MGFLRSRRSIERCGKAWERVLERMAQHGAPPQVVGRAFNFPLDNLHQVPPVVLALLLAWRLVDADSELAAEAGWAPLARTSRHSSGGVRAANTCAEITCGE